MDIPSLPSSVSAPELELTPSAVSARPSSLPPRRGRRWILWSSIVVVVIGVSVGGYFAYARGWLSIPFLSPSAEQLFDRMINTLGDIQNAQYSVRLHLATEARQTGTKPFASNTNVSDLTANTSGPVGDALRLVNPDDIVQFLPADATVDGGITLYAEANRPLRDANALVKIDGTYSGGDSQFSLAVEGRKIEQQLYVLLSKFPSLPFFDLSNIKGKWIVITPTDVPGLWSDDVLKSTNTHQALERTKTSLTNILKQHVFTIDKTLSDETVAGARSKHYQIALHPDQLPAVYQQLIAERKAKQQSTTELEQQLATLQTPDAAAALRVLADNSRVEIWVDTSKGMLRQARWTLAVVPPENATNLKDKQVTIGLTLTLDRVNEAVSIPTPTPTTSYNDALELLGNSEATTSTTPTNAATNTNTTAPISLFNCFSGEPATTTDSDRDGLMDDAEVFTYLTNPCQSDSDGDTFPDGTEVQNGYNPTGAGKATDAQRSAWAAQ